ncbi:MAG: fumarylacetoacetate hydrolase family protein, partial [Terriglobales bacterium]
LGVVIARRCRHVREDEDVRPYILGYTCVNDFTARDLQTKDGQWARAKSFDTFCPVGPLVSDGVDSNGEANDDSGRKPSLDPWAGVPVETRVNGEIRQAGNTRDFIFSLDVILRFISQVMTLHPGDLIATGTPSGVGPVVGGDVVEISIPGIGVLRNPVADEG